MRIKQIMAFIALMTTMTLAHAVDMCPKTDIAWLGTFTYKNQDDCKRTLACTHMLTGTSKQISENTWQVDLWPRSMPRKSFTVTCENGVITVPQYPDKKMKITCTEKGMCIFIFDDPYLAANMVTVKED